MIPVRVEFRSDLSLENPNRARKRHWQRRCEGSTFGGASLLPGSLPRPPPAFSRCRRQVGGRQASTSIASSRSRSLFSEDSEASLDSSSRPGPSSEAMPSAMADAGNVEALAALQHVLTEVCRFGKDSPVVKAGQNGEFRSVDDLCSLTDGDVSDWVARDLEAAANQSAQAGGGKGWYRIWVQQQFEVRTVRLLRLWCAHLYRETGAVPSDGDWLRFTAQDFDAFSVAAEAITPPPPAAPWPGLLVPEHWRICRHQLAKDFVSSITNQHPVPIEGSGGMFVMNDVVSIESGGSCSATVLPRRLHRFWQACLDAVDANDVDPSEPRCRVVAVGSSGVGKTECTPYLIKMLLERNKTVVYHVRATTKDSPVYEFIALPGREADCVITNVYRVEGNSVQHIPSLSDPDTYYIVDPGMAKDSCDMDCSFRPKVIIVAGPDERLWGSSDFFKGRGGVEGVLAFFPLWELDELLHARPYLAPEMTEDQVKDRFPSHIFRHDDRSLKRLLDRQAWALNALAWKPDQFQRLSQPEKLPVFDHTMPANCLVGYDVDGRDDGTFTSCVVKIVAKRAVDEALAYAAKDGRPPLMDRFGRYLH